MRRNDKGDGPIPDPIAILDAVIDHVAEEEAETGEPTEQDLRWSHDLRREMQSRIAALRGRLTSAQPIAQPVSPVSTEVRALDREGLLARLKALRLGDDDAQDLTEMSDDDLRRMLATLMGPAGG